MQTGHTHDAIVTGGAAEPFEVREPLMLVSIGQSYSGTGDGYEEARFAWRIDPGRARRYELVLAHCRGIVVGAFRPDEWLEATGENFPGRGTEPGRWGFCGRPAEPEIEDLYVGRSVPDRLRPRGAANPVRYCDLA